MSLSKKWLGAVAGVMMTSLAAADKADALTITIDESRMALLTNTTSNPQSPAGFELGELFKSVFVINDTTLDAVGTFTTVNGDVYTEGYAGAYNALNTSLQLISNNYDLIKVNFDNTVALAPGASYSAFADNLVANGGSVDMDIQIGTDHGIGGQYNNGVALTSEVITAQATAPAVPLPGGLALLVGALGGLAELRRRKLANALTA